MTAGWGLRCRGYANIASVLMDFLNSSAAVVLRSLHVINSMWLTRIFSSIFEFERITCSFWIQDLSQCTMNQGPKTKMGEVGWGWFLLSLQGFLPVWAQQIGLRAFHCKTFVQKRQEMTLCTHGLGFDNKRKCTIQNHLYFSSKDFIISSNNIHHNRSCCPGNK